MFFYCDIFLPFFISVTVSCFNFLIHDSIPKVPIYARALDLKHLLDLKKAGATDAILENAEVLSIISFPLLMVGACNNHCSIFWRKSQLNIKFILAD